MDQALVRLAQAYGLIHEETHAWPEKVDEDILEFISSVDSRAIFVVKQQDGLVIGPPPRNVEAQQVLVIAKPRGALSESDWDQNVVSVSLPLTDGALFRYLHTMVSQIVLPMFDSQNGVAGAQARHRLVEAGNALAQLLRHTQVAFVDLTSGKAASKAQELLQELEDEPASANKLLNELQSVVNTWKQQVSQLSSSDRDVKEGSVSEEIGFWVALEAALNSVQEQLGSPLVTGVWQALEQNKRFHATHNFSGETGLTEALTKVQGYTQLLFRDLPIGELVSASNIQQLINATEAVFTHFNRKLRASGYPSQRSVAFVEAIGRDFHATLTRIAGAELDIIFDEEGVDGDYHQLINRIAELKLAVSDAADVWDTHTRDFATVARDLMRRRAERFVVVKVESSHHALIDRMNAIYSLCQKYVELAPLLHSSGIESGPLTDLFNEVLEAKVLQLDTHDWSRLETRFSRQSHAAEKLLAERLQNELSAAKDDELVLYDVFTRNQMLLSSPEVRAVAHKFQTTLLNTARRELRAAERRAAELPDPATHLVECVVKSRQLQISAADIRNRLAVILGSTWRDHTDGAEIGQGCDVLEARLNLSSVVKRWEEHLRAEEEHEEQGEDGESRPRTVFQINGKNLVVTEPLALKGLSIRALKGLGLRFDPLVNSLVESLTDRYTASSRLSDCLASIQSIIATMNNYPRLKTSSAEITHHSHQVMAFVRLGLYETRWASSDLSEFVYGIERAVSLLEQKVEQLATTDAQVTELLLAGSSTHSISEIKQQIAELLLSSTHSHPEYSAAVIADRDAVIEQRVVEQLQNWQPSQPTHFLLVENRSIKLSPDLSSTLSLWYSELSEIASPIEGYGDRFVAEYSVAVDRIREAWAAAQSQAEHWLAYEPLWSLTIDDVLSKHAAHMDVLLNLVNELRSQQAKDLSRSQTPDQSHGDSSAIHLDLSRVRSLLDSKCDAWLHVLLNALAKLTHETSSDMIMKSRAARKSIEASRVDLSGILEGINELNSAQQILAEAETALPLLNEATKLLRRVKFEYSPGGSAGSMSWEQTDQVNDEFYALKTVLDRRQADLQAAKPRLLKELESRTASLVGEIDSLRQRWLANKPLQPQVDPDQALKILKEFEGEVGAEKARLDSIASAFHSLDPERTKPIKLQRLASESAKWLEEIEALTLGWLDIRSIWQALRKMGSQPWFEVDAKALAQQLDNLNTQMAEFPDRTKELRGFTRVQTYHQECVNSLPKISLLRESEAIDQRHLAELVPSIAAASAGTAGAGAGAGKVGASAVRLNDVWSKLPDLATISRVVEAAEGEYQLLRFLNNMNSKWLSTTLEGRDGAIYNLDSIIQLARDNQTALTAMHSSKFFSAVSAAVQDWERRVGQAQQVFDLFVDVQQQYMYLRGVLTAESVLSILPHESRQFKKVSDEFAQIYLSSNGKQALAVAGMPRLSANLSRLRNQFAALHRSLAGFLEAQRQKFPRLYFVGDDDLLEIVGTPLDAWGAKYLPSIFPGIASLSSPSTAVSPEGEILNLVRPLSMGSVIKSNNNVDLLVELQTLMQESLKSAVFSAIQQLAQIWPDASKLGDWIKSFPLQAITLALREQWSRHVAAAAANADASTAESPTIEQLVQEYDSILQWLSSTGGDSLLWARRRETMIALLTHARDHLSPEFPELELMFKAANNQIWIEQGVLHRDNTQGGLSRGQQRAWEYGYEYLGAYEPIVQTQLNDDLFFSATAAVAQQKGMSIIGPAGTGKTESIKALGALFGKRVIVFNCDDKFDFLSVSRVMNGCASTKVWACFDEFNRLSKAVLSSVAQLVSDSVRSSPVFVTMNPGYLGRTSLPPNMRERFREFVLEGADAQSIARVLLCAHGKISPKLSDATVDLLQFLDRQASKQRQYDWGLRALKGIIRISRILNGNIRLACEIAIRPRLVGQDRELFDTKLNELIPKDPTTVNGTTSLSDSLSDSFRLLGSKSSKSDSGNTVDSDTLEPYVETLNAFIKLFPGVMLYGPSGCGKTRIRTLLAESCDSETVIVDPSAVSKSTLIGELNPITREWKDGLLSRLIRRVLNNLRGEQSKEWFVVFDGVIEPEWAEALNSLLDDTRRLTLASGEILALPSQVHIVFETSNLDSATPATISRCGMICVPPYVPQQLHHDIPHEVMDVAAKIHHSMGFVNAGLNDRIAQLDLGNKWLSLAWALAGDSNRQGKLELTKAMRAHCDLKGLPSTEGAITDYFVSDLTGSWYAWADSVGDCPNLTVDSVIRPEIVIPTVDTVSHESLLQSALSSHIPLLLCGPPGSGKTMTLFNALRQIQQVLTIPLNFSSTSTPEIVIQALEMHCELITANDGSQVLSPPGSKWGVLFIDEINLPQPSASRTSEVVPVLQFIRFMIENQGYINYSGEFVKLERIQVVGACNPPPMRRPLPLSLLRHFMVVNVDYPSLRSLNTIYSALMGTFGADQLVNPMLAVYEGLSRILPEETWSPRELTRWMRGIYVSWSATLESQQSRGLLGELWIYEACRVLSDRLVPADRDLVLKLLRDNYPTGLQCPTTENLASRVWTRCLAQRPKFVGLETFREFLVARLSVFVEEASAEADNNLIVHDALVEHVSRIERVLRQPQGHLLLVGPPSVGKKTSVKFATWLVGLELRELRFHARYTDSDFAQDLRSVLVQSIKRPLCMLMGEELLEIPAFAEKMNSLLANGEVPGLFETQEQQADLEDQCQRCGFNGGDLIPWFRARIVKHLHVVFTSSTTAQASPALLNRCVVNRVNPWSPEIRMQIARHWCSTTDVSPGTVNVLASLSPPTKPISTGAASSWSGGVSFLELCRQFVRLYKHYKEELEESQRHFVSGSDRIKSTVIEIGNLERKLAQHKQDLAKEDLRSQEVLALMLKEQSEAERKRVAAIEIKAALEVQASEIQQRQQAANDDLAATEPLIHQAAEGVQNIKKAQLNELRSMMNPPEPVKITLEAVCLVLGLHTDGSWRQVLAAVRGDEFIPRIVHFDSRRITDSLIRVIETDYMSIPSFTYERVNRASKACGPLLRWVVAQIAYGRAISAIKPLMEEIDSLNKESEESKAQLDAIESMLGDLESSIEKSKQDYGNTIAQCELLKSEMQSVNMQLSRAESLLSSLTDEKERWSKESKGFAENAALIPGRALIEAAVIAMSGKMDFSEKQQFLHSIEEQCKSHSIIVSQATASQALNVDTNQWIVDSSWSVPLIIDPSDRWDPTLFSESNLKVTSFLLDPDALAKEVDSALRFGQSLVIKHAERFDPLLLPLLTRSFSRKGTRLYVNLGLGDIDVSSNFRLLLHARDVESVTRASPLVMSRVNVVDYSVTQSKFQSMVAEALLLAQRPKLAEKRTELQEVDSQTSKRLRKLEHQLLTVLAESSATEKLLENQTLVHSLEKLKAETVQLREVQSTTAKTLEELDAAVRGFQPEAQLASKVYGSLKRLPEIDSFYVFGVDWLWEVVQRLADSPQFSQLFVSEVRSRAMSISKSQDWERIEVISDSQADIQKQPALSLVEVIRECPCTTPIIAGMVTTNTTDPADILMAENITDVQVVAMGSSQSIIQAERLLSEAIETGTWLVIQNIEIADEEWIGKLTRRVQSSSPADGFRLIMTGIQSDIVEIPDIIASGRPITIEKQHGIKRELQAVVRESMDPTDFMVCWVHACFTRYFTALSFSVGDLQAARWFVEAFHGNNHALIRALLTAVWGAKTGSDVEKRTMKTFLEDTRSSKSITLPETKFDEWTRKLPDDMNWVPEALAVQSL